MRNMRMKSALALLCMCLAGGTMQAKAAPEDHPAEPEVGIVFHNDYDTKKPDEKEKDKGDKKEETNKGQAGGGEETKSGSSESTVQPKSVLPQTGETGSEGEAGILAGILLAAALGIWKQKR